MLIPSLTGPALGLAAAAVWGGGDFCGGLAARRLHAAAVVAAVGGSGALLLLALALLRGEGIPAGTDLQWAVAAGVAGAAGLAALYRALAVGSAAVVAPCAAVVGALVPVAFGVLVAQPPGLAQLAGFVLALTGIGLVTRDRSGATSLRGLGTAASAGVFLGGFLVLLAQVSQATVFAPLLAARLVMLLAAVAAVLALRAVPRGRAGIAVALLAGLLDAAGNGLYLLATHHTRIDVAGVLASLYPVSTVVLSRLVLKQSVSAPQWAGVGVCAVAVTLIAS